MRDMLLRERQVHSNGAAVKARQVITHRPERIEGSEYLGGLRPLTLLCGSRRDMSGTDVPARSSKTLYASSAKLAGSLRFDPREVAASLRKRMHNNFLMTTHF